MEFSTRSNRRKIYHTQNGSFSFYYYIFVFMRNTLLNSPAENYFTKLVLVFQKWLLDSITFNFIIVKFTISYFSLSFEVTSINKNVVMRVMNKCSLRTSYLDSFTIVVLTVLTDLYWKTYLISFVALNVCTRIICKMSDFNEIIKPTCILQNYYKKV